MIASNPMEAVFYYPTRMLAVFVVGSIFFGVMGVGSIIASFTDPSIAHPFTFAIVLGGLWCSMACLALFTAATCRRYELLLGEGHVAQRNLIKQKVMDLGAVTEADWRWPRSAIILRASNDKLTIDLKSFAQADTLQIIRFFRKKIPAERQRHWESFALKAVRLRDQVAREAGPLAVDEVLVTRRRWDWFMLPLVPIFIAVGAYLYGVTGKLDRLLAAPAGPLLLWLALRFAIPQQGMRSKRISAEPDAWFILICLGSLLLCLAGIIASVVWAWPEPANSTATWVIGLICLGAIFVAASRLDRQRKRRGRENASLAAKKWEFGEAAAQPDRATQ